MQTLAAFAVATPLPGSSPQLLEAVTLGLQSALEIRRHSLHGSWGSVCDCTHRTGYCLGLHWGTHTGRGLEGKGTHIGRGLEGKGALGLLSSPYILSGGSWARPPRDRAVGLLFLGYSGSLGPRFSPLVDM